MRGNRWLQKRQPFGSRLSSDSYYAENNTDLLLTTQIVCFDCLAEQLIPALPRISLFSLILKE